MCKRPLKRHTRALYMAAVHEHRLRLRPTVYVGSVCDTHGRCRCSMQFVVLHKCHAYCSTISSPKFFGQSSQCVALTDNLSVNTTGIRVFFRAYFWIVYQNWRRFKGAALEGKVYTPLFEYFLHVCESFCLIFNSFHLQSRRLFCRTF